MFSSFTILYIFLSILISIFRTVFLGQLQNEISGPGNGFDSMIEPMEHVRAELSSIPSSPPSPYCFASPENCNFTPISVKNEPHDSQNDLILPSIVSLSSSPVNLQSIADNSNESSAEPKDAFIAASSTSAPSPGSSSASEAFERPAEEAQDRLEQEVEFINDSNVGHGKKDGLDLFMESVAARLKKFDLIKQELVMLKIQQIMYDLQDE